MWPWRKRYPFENLDLPQRVFISHSYQDAEARERLLVMLPKSVEPVVFPPITVSPEQMVSNHLIEALLGCDGLIYFEQGYSADSFWVAFERDYALRAEKQVFAYNPGQRSLAQDTSTPLGLPIFPVWTARDTPRVRPILEFMRDERFFAPWDLERLARAAAENVNPAPKMLMEFRRLVEEGGYAVIFLSQHAMISNWVNREMEAAVRIGLEQASTRVVPVYLDEYGRDEYIRTFRRPDPDAIQLYGDTARPERHRIDDLIVRLYWLIYRTTRQNQLT
jgi:hypothetical protein